MLSSQKMLSLRPSLLVSRLKFKVSLCRKTPKVPCPSLKRKTPWGPWLPPQPLIRLSHKVPQLQKLQRHLSPPRPPRLQRTHKPQKPLVSVTHYRSLKQIYPVISKQSRYVIVVKEHGWDSWLTIHLEPIFGSALHSYQHDVGFLPGIFFSSNPQWIPYERILPLIL